MKKVLYLFAGVNRCELEKKVLVGEAPDTAFFGFTHLKENPGIEASYIQLGKDTYTFAGAFFRRFALTRAVYVALKFYNDISRHDAVVLASSAYFFLPLLKSIGLFHRQEFYLLNLDLNIRFKQLEGKPWGKFWLRAAVTSAKRIICISKHQERYLLELGFDPKQVVFVPMGVDKNFYQPIESSQELILTVGRDVGRDFETFLAAVAGLKERVVMICSPYNTKGLEDKIPPNLTVLYDQPYSVLKEYYRKAKLFVLATKPGEALIGSDCPGQTSVLDTLAYGMPLVATRMPWFEGYFESGRHLVVVEPKNPKALEEAVREVVNDPALLSKLSKEGRRHIDETSSSEAMGRRIAEIILESV